MKLSSLFPSKSKNVILGSLFVFLLVVILLSLLMPIAVDGFSDYSTAYGKTTGPSIVGGGVNGNVNIGQLGANVGARANVNTSGLGGTIGGGIGFKEGLTTSGPAKIPSGQKMKSGAKK